MTRTSVITRRAALAGAFASSAAIAIPASAALAKTRSSEDDPATRVGRLTEELSNALSDYQRGQFRAIVEPSSHQHANISLQNMRSANAPSLDALIDLHRTAVVVRQAASDEEVRCFNQTEQIVPAVQYGALHGTGEALYHHELRDIIEDANSRFLLKVNAFGVPTNKALGERRAWLRLKVGEFRAHTRAKRQAEAASGLTAATKAWEVSHEAALDALVDVLIYRPRSPAEAAIKSSYLDECRETGAESFAPEEICDLIIDALGRATS